MKKRTLIFLADGFEIVEAMTVVDYLRRADFDVVTVSVEAAKTVTSSHGVLVEADSLLGDIDPASADALIIPGGLGGARSLASNKTVTAMLKDAFEAKKLVAAICAGPVVLEAAGIAEHVEGTSYPGFEEELSYRAYRTDLAVTSGNVVTSRGPATAIHFAGAIITALAGADSWSRVRADILQDLVEAGA